MLNIKFKQNAGSGNAGGSGDQYYVLLGAVLFCPNEGAMEVNVDNSSYNILDSIKQFVVSIDLDFASGINVTDFKEKTDESLKPFVYSGDGYVQQLAIGSMASVGENKFDIKCLAIKLDDFMKHAKGMSEPSSPYGIKGLEVGDLGVYSMRQYLLPSFYLESEYGTLHSVGYYRSKPGSEATYCDFNIIGYLKVE